MIDTAKVTRRRTLHFSTPDQMMADVALIEAAAARSSLRTSGNWTAGQIFGHLSTWVDFAFSPAPLRPPWFIKLVLRFRKQKFLNGPLPAGVRIPKVAGGTLGTADLPLDEGLRRFRRSWERLRSEPPTQPNLIFGPLAHDEWMRMHLRHAELHLSFLHPSV